MNKYIATFGANQPNEGYYLTLYANDYKTAVDYMETNYPQNYCMVYYEEQWEDWAKEANRLGFMVEKELNTIKL